jgi:chorismate mutase/prephenate dehydratase
VTRETYVRVEHALLAYPQTRLNDVIEVRSHPQALAQCSEFFHAHPGIRPVVWFDTAGAAASLQPLPGNGPAQGVAAIASEAAGTIYGLKVLRRNLQNRADNYTRFLCIARSPERLAPLSAVWKTSLTFIPRRNKAGVLHAVTGVFASRGIDLSKIESSPDPDNPFDYRFYLDAAGDAKKLPLKAALEDLKKLVREMRILGSYPAAKLPGQRS